MGTGVRTAEGTTAAQRGGQPRLERPTGTEEGGREPRGTRGRPGWTHGVGVGPAVLGGTELPGPRHIARATPKASCPASAVVPSSINA